MKPADVQYLTDAPARWKDALDSALTLERLTETLFEWRELCPDAWEGRPINGEEFTEWRKGLDMERGRPGKRQRFAGPAWADRYGAILLPGELLRVALFADQYKCPWGTAYIRLMVIRAQEAKHDR
jgi:hypothetical protein